MKVIASQIRKGNVVDYNGQLCVVLTAENFHPGKGTPTTQIDMRRISDGVKVSQRFKTTEQVERAFVEDHDYQYLYEDGEGFTFMNGETFDQVHVPRDVVGDYAPYLQENMTVKLSLHEGVPIAIELPQRVTLEVMETEPGDEGTDGRLLLQAGASVERREDQRAATHLGRHAHRGDDRRRLLRRARQGLTVSHTTRATPGIVRTSADSAKLASVASTVTIRNLSVAVTVRPRIAVWIAITMNQWTM